MAKRSLLQLMPALCLISVLLSVHRASSCEQEDYWRMKLPKVSMPQAIKDSLYHHSNVDRPKEKNEDVVDPSALGSNKKTTDTNQPYTVFSWKYDEAENPQEKVEHVVEPLTFSSNKMTSSTKQPYTVFSWKYDEIKEPQENKKMISRTKQPYTVFSWKYDETKESQENKMTSRTKQPYTVYSWKYDETKEPQANKKMISRTKQPYTVFSWKYDETKEPQENKKMISGTKQPYTVFSWKYDEAKESQENKRTSSTKQPYTVFSWKYDETKEPQENKKMTSRTKQPFTVLSWKYDETKEPQENKKMTSPTKQPYTVFSWKYDETKKPQENKMTSHTKQPYTVYSWKYDEDKKDESKAENVGNPLELKMNEASQHHHHSIHNNMNFDQEDQNDGGSVFFVEESLRIGMKLKHDFQKTPRTPFLPKQIAQAIPFEVEKYAEILDLLSVDPESTEATAIKETLGVCLQRPKVKKENRTCAQSMEDVVDFVIRELGTNDVKVRMMDNNIEVPNGIQDYVLTKVKKLQVPGNNAVACHRMSYPYIVYYCHHQQDIGHYDVTLVDPSSPESAIQTTAVCHYDTYAWQPNVPALRYLGIRPGDAPVCHFSAINDMFWSLNAESKSLDMVQ